MSYFQVDHATKGIFALDLETGRVLADENSSKSLIPASCMKIITTAAALKLLGPSFYFETHLEYDGFIDQEGVLQGNVYIKGYGDPSLGSKRFGGYNKQLLTWKEAIRNLGIKRIEGQIIGDASHWEKALAIPSWQWEDLGNYYGSGASALSFNDNEYTLFFEKKGLGESVSIEKTDPEICHSLKSEVIVGPSGSISTIFGCEFSSVHMARGQIAEDSDFSIRGSFSDPALQASFMLSKIVEACGNYFPPTKRTVFHKTKSPPLEDIVYWTNQQSINLYAEHLLKQMGQGSSEKGILAVKGFLKNLEIPLDGFQMADGSGLSRKNLVTAKLMVELLSKMKGNVAFERSLPDELGKTKAKSGSMSAIKGYVGYKDQKAFAILVNHFLDYETRMKEIGDFLIAL